MSVLYRFLLPSRRWAFLIALALTASPAIAADKITLRVEVFGMGGMHVASDRTVIEESLVALGLGELQVLTPL